MAGEPARGYSWPQFTEGNEASVQHGGTSPRVFGPVADELEAEIRSTTPWLGRPEFRRTVRAWAVAEAKAQVIDAWLDVNGLLDADGEPRNAAVLSDRMHARATSLRAAMGLDPQSFGKLLATYETTTTAVDVREALIAAGMATMAGRAVQALPAAPDAAERPEARP